MNLPRAPKAVVFDLDGTLIDSEALVKEAWFAASAQLGVPLTEALFLSCVGMHREHNERQLRDVYGADFDTHNFYETTRAHVGMRVPPLKAGALELMDALDARALPYALATSSRREWVERNFEAHNLAHRFQAVVTRQDCVEGKPHPEPYLNAAELLGHAPMDILALEDSYAGVTAAHAAGMMTIMIPDLLAPNDDMHARTVRIVDTLNDVAALLR